MKKILYLITLFISLSIIYNLWDYFKKGTIPWVENSIEIVFFIVIFLILKRVFD